MVHKDTTWCQKTEIRNKLRTIFTQVTWRLECRTTKRKVVPHFHVTSRATKPILGGEACEELQLVRRVEELTARSPQPGKPPATKEELLQRYAEVFTGLGEFPEVHPIHIDPCIMPVIHACRNVLLSIMDSLRDTLEDLQNRKVIIPVTEPTEWVNSYVATNKKNGMQRSSQDWASFLKFIPYTLTPASCLWFTHAETYYCLSWTHWEIHLKTCRTGKW